jgi:hypothetical protein
MPESSSRWRSTRCRSNSSRRGPKRRISLPTKANASGDRIFRCSAVNGATTRNSSELERLDMRVLLEESIRFVPPLQL